MSERPVTRIGPVHPSTDARTISIGLYEEDRLSTFRLDAEAMVELALRGLNAATVNTSEAGVALQVVGFESRPFPDGGVALRLELGTGERLRFLVPPEGARALRDELTRAIDQSDRARPGGNEREP